MTVVPSRERLVEQRRAANRACNFCFWCGLAAGLVLTAIALGVTGCANTLGHEPVPGWPALRIVEHRVPHAVMRDRCMPYMPFGFSPEACAEFHFDKGECHIWLSADFPPSPRVVEHERLHCGGMDHAGSRQMRNALERWRAR